MYKITCAVIGIYHICSVDNRLGGLVLNTTSHWFLMMACNSDQYE